MGSILDGACRPGAGRRLRRAPTALAAVLVAATAGAAPLQPGTATAVPDCSQASAVAWRELVFTARKLFLTARATLTLDLAPAAQAADALRRPPDGRGVRPSEPCVARITLESDLPVGTDERATAWVNPRDGEVEQVDKRTFSGHPYRKVFRYLTNGYYMWRWSPADRAEAGEDPSHWTHLKERLVTSPRPTTDKAVLTDTYALLYIVSGMPFEQPGARHTTLMFADERLAEVTFTAGPLTYRRIDVEESWPGGSRKRSGKVLVRTVAVAAAPLDSEAGGGVDLGFLGIRGDLTIYLEAGTGIPVELTGRADAIGWLRVALKRVVLAEPPAAKGGAS